MMKDCWHKKYKNFNKVVDIKSFFGYIKFTDAMGI